MVTLYLRRLALAFLPLLFLLSIATTVNAQAITENFDDVTLLPANGWAQQNLSTPVGLLPYWSQGDGTVFAAFNGAANSFIGCSFNCVTGANTISNWLFAPNRTFNNGDVITFYTRTTDGTYPDRLEVRLSTNGASVNAGATNVSVGDFTTLLLTINPSLTNVGYPVTFTQYTITLSGLAGPTSGRVAFRYFVTNGGPSGANSDYIGVDAFTYTPFVSCPTITITPASLPNATAGTAYSQSLSQTGGVGTVTYSLQSGAWPAGITMSGAGVISGTPTVTGTFNVTVKVTDGNSCTGTKAYTLIVGCPTITISPATLPNGTAGVAYSQSLSQTGGLGTITYSILSGSLPSGVTLSGAGVLSGTPTVTGTFNFTAKVTDGNGCTGTLAYTLVIACPTITISPATLPNGTAGVAYSQSLSQTGGLGTITYSILSGSLPSGVTLSGAGVLSGTPTVTGTFNFTAKVTDGNGCTGTLAYTLVIACPTITISPATLPGGTAGVAYSQSLSQTGGLGTITYSILSGSLPSGVTLSAAGVLSGTPTVTGTFNFTAKVTDGNGCTGTLAYTLVIACPTITISPATLPGGTAGVAYSQSLSQTGGVGSITYSIQSGSLPAGVTLSTGGLVSGTPTATGTFNFTAKVTDANACTGTRAYTIVIACPTITISPATVPNGTAGVAYSQSLSQTGGVGSITYSILSGSLPTGITLSGAGVLSGTPTVTGTFNFTVKVADGNACIGTLAYTLVIACPVITISPATLPNGTISVAYSQSLSQAGGVGSITYSVLSGALPGGLTLSTGGLISGTPTAPGVFNFTIKVTDGNGCTGTLATSISISCPPGGATLTAFSAVCSNAADVLLSGGAPAGGTYSGVGVSAGFFDPSVGTQTITYTAIAANGCPLTASTPFPVNTAPVVTLDTFPPICTNASAFILYGGLPAGGAYSGPDVISGAFWPTVAGASPVKYIYTNGNGCTDSATRNMTVNNAAANALAGTTGNTETRSFMVVGATDARYTDCDLIADITPSGAQPLNGTTSFGVKIDNTVTTFNGQPYVQRHYDIVPVNNAANATANLTLYAYQSEFNAYNVQAAIAGLPLLPTGATNNGNVRITQFHGTGTAPGNYTGGEVLIVPTVSWDATNDWWVMTFPVTGFSGFYIHTGFGNPLAINVADINAVNDGSSNIVKWETKTEQPGDMFVLEHSADGRSFTSLVSMPAKGAASDYTYRDETPVKGVNYYRLKLVSAGNEESYTKVVSATVKSSGSVLVQAYPNPVSDKVTVKAFGQQGNANISITDVTGRQLMRTTMPDNGIATIDISALSSGVYYVVYSDAVNTQTIKINKQ